MDTAPQTSAQALQVMLAVLRGLAFVHNCNIIHTDLKPENVLFKRNSEPAIADFGSATERGSARELQRRANVRLASPELLENWPFDTHTDIYSLGQTLLDVISPPGPDSMYLALFQIPLEELQTLPCSMANYIRGLVATDPTLRPSAECAAEQLQSVALQLGCC
ncbi:unnamed protein product [Symbiodinium pilosum]|uniref:Protein kinase domain-containing protein n=1 Tax=Symbiodinium pilosum TaxID=2952 RepID=A0A812JGD1_SYMPI|nr:unnamed protein product [Symbiodinium pilosum]